ncbi:hypothetical protein K2Y11_12110 [bacterium]|nr:hypothetical protein [bacterium]
MRRNGILGMVLPLVLVVGCAPKPLFVGPSRPAIAPAPTTAQEEKRDARFFLAYPDESVGPSSGLAPDTM